jgi:hypothetical protein
MHAWQGVEHDIVYKNLEVESPSDDQTRLIDLFNGIIMTGQVALEQLEMTIKKQDATEAAEDTALIHNPSQLAAVIDRHCIKVGLDTYREPQWTYLRQLLSTLKATKWNQVSRVGELCGKINHKSHPSSIRGMWLPLEVLNQLCTTQQPSFDIVTLSYPANKEYLDARIWALRFVHTLNMAEYFGVSSKFLRNVARIPNRRPEPHFEDFLDVLHPQQVMTNNTKRQRLVEFCRHVLDYATESFQGGSWVEAITLHLIRELPIRSLVVLPYLPDTMHNTLKHRKLIECNNSVTISKGLLVLCDVLRYRNGSSRFDDYREGRLYFSPVLDRNMEKQHSWELVKRMQDYAWEVQKLEFVRHEEFNTEIQYKMYSADVKPRSLEQRLRSDHSSKLKDLLKDRRKLRDKQPAKPKA